MHTDNLTVSPMSPLNLEQIRHTVHSLCTDLVDFQQSCHTLVSNLERGHRQSAINLLHYLALRRHDIRQVQEGLAALGLSSLGRSESHVLATLTAVSHLLHLMAHRAEDINPLPESMIGFAESKVLQEARTEVLLGPSPADRHVRIMVTMPSEAADDYALVRDILASGMDCMRINCAHDDAQAWTHMIMHLRRAEQEVGRRARVLMDLAGPKLRTGALMPGPQVIKWRPRRDVYGRMAAPARIWLTPAHAPEVSPEPADACLPVPTDWLEPTQGGELVTFTDTRGASRSLTITHVVGKSRWATATQTCYVGAGTVLRRRPTDQEESGHPCDAAVGPLPPRPQALVLKTGDTLLLTRDSQPGRPASYEAQGRLQTPARIPCTLPEIFADVQAGESIWFDDGKIGGVIQAVTQDHLVIQITQARPRGDKLRADKGINLPDSALRLPALTPKDTEDVAFIATHADLVGYSFVRTAADVVALQTHLAALGAPELGMVLKIETRQAFEQLPELLFAAMRSPAVGVMIARGDLAIECGYERLAEVQEEMLWICEAAHLPVIWATQVLESLAKVGAPSRAEITDAAMGERAECVMLNKGPHVVAAVRSLADILQRMQAHQSKKTPRLRPLRLARRFGHTA
jgi:pyruvate kinase